MDDCVKSVPDENQAISLVQNLKKICATGGFKLTKWTSNSRSALASLPAKEKETEVKNIDLEKDKLPVERVLRLGVMYAVCLQAYVVWFGFVVFFSPSCHFSQIYP